MADWTGLEPATPGVTGRYSNQLNYQSVCSYILFEPIYKSDKLVGGAGIEPATLAL